MPFNELEDSLSDGQPVKLYQFVRGTQQWTYASGDRDISHLARVYRSLAGGISDAGLTQGGEDGTNNVRITAPGDLDVAQLYRGIPPSDTIELVIYEMHYGDPDYRVSFVGEVQGVSFPAADRCEIRCSPESVSMQSQGLKLCWERACPHSLYGRGCTVDRNAYAVAATITGIDGVVISVTGVGSYSDGWFNAGYIEWPVSNGNYDRRAIESHVGNDLTIFGGVEGLSVTQDIVAYPGCDQTPTTCNTKFGNMPNYGGFRHMPGRSP
ncbi:MAG: hypothetical protein GY784_09630, partial [Gammaproteobacteria bacterium]|nr:hypothetical protein [Gammaproteobacteria bacterium]